MIMKPATLFCLNACMSAELRFYIRMAPFAMLSCFSECNYLKKKRGRGEQKKRKREKEIFTWDNDDHG